MQNIDTLAIYSISLFLNRILEPMENSADSLNEKWKELFSPFEHREYPKNMALTMLL